MVSLTFEGIRYYYCMTTDTYYNNKYQKVNVALSDKLDKANRSGHISLTSKKPEEEKKEVFFTYFKDSKNQKMSNSDLEEIFKDKQSKHERDIVYLKRLQKKYNLKWTTMNFNVVANKNSNELKKFLSKELINHTCEVKGNKGTFSIDLPLVMIDYQTILERIDELVGGNILSK